MKGQSLDVIHSGGAGVEEKRLPESFSVRAAVLSDSFALISKGMLLSNKKLMEISVCQSRALNSIDCSQGL